MPRAGCAAGNPVRMKQPAPPCAVRARGRQRRNGKGTGEDGARSRPEGAQAGFGSTWGMRKVRRAGTTRRRNYLDRSGRTGALWRSGALALWRSGALALWRSGALALWRSGALALWRSGALALWRSGALALWRSGALALWRSGALALWRSGALALWRSGALALNYTAGRIRAVKPFPHFAILIHLGEYNVPPNSPSTGQGREPNAGQCNHLFCIFMFLLLLQVSPGAPACGWRRVRGRGGCHKEFANRP